MATNLKHRFGPTALITGASDGIGRAFAAELAAQGFDLILVARRVDVLEAIALDLSSTHGVAVKVVADDLARPDAVEALLDETATEGIGLLIAAAGFGSVGRFLDLDVHVETDMVDVNCRSVVELTHGVAARMAVTGKGGIVLFGSVVGFQGVPGSATYAATKAFIQSFAEALSVELAPRGVTVLSVAPGPVATGFAARSGMRMGRAETPQTVARVALAALTRGGTVRPGPISKLLGWSLSLLPRWGRVRLLGQIMKGMTARALRP
jgi:short-subunit dehydrogenase